MPLRLYVMMLPDTLPHQYYHHRPATPVEILTCRPNRWSTREHPVTLNSSAIGWVSDSNEFRWHRRSSDSGQDQCYMNHMKHIIMQTTLPLKRCLDNKSCEHFELCPYAPIGSQEFNVKAPCIAPVQDINEMEADSSTAFPNPIVHAVQRQTCSF